MKTSGPRRQRRDCHGHRGDGAQGGKRPSRTGAAAELPGPAGLGHCRCALLNGSWSLWKAIPQRHLPHRETPGSWDLIPSAGAGSAPAERSGRGESNPAAAGRGGLQRDPGQGRSAGFGSRVLGLEEKQPAVPCVKMLREFPRGLCWMLADLLDPGLCRCSGPGRCGAAVRRLQAVSAALPAFAATELPCKGHRGMLRSALPFVQPAWGWGGGCTEPPGLCRPSPCGALQRSGGDGLGPPSGS